MKPMPTCPLHGLFTTSCPYCEHELAAAPASAQHAYVIRGAVNGPVKAALDRVGPPILNVPVAIQFAEVERMAGVVGGADSLKEGGR